MQDDWRMVPFGGKKTGKGGKEVPSCKATFHRDDDDNLEYVGTTSTGDSNPKRFAPGEVEQILHDVGIIELRKTKSSHKSMYTCAESRAVAGLIRKHGIVESQVENISVITISSQGVWVPCPQCIQWLVQGKNGRYWIKRSFPSL